jgi:hypothetical protein
MLESEIWDLKLHVRLRSKKCKQMTCNKMLKYNIISSNFINILRLKFEIPRETHAGLPIKSRSLWRWYINKITDFWTVSIVLFLFKIHNFSEIWFYLGGRERGTGSVYWISSEDVDIMQPWETFVFLIKTGHWIMSQNTNILHVKCLLLMSDFNQNLYVSTNFAEAP